MRSRGWVRVVVWLVVIAAVGAGILWYWKRSTGKTEVRYRTESVDRGSVAQTVTATGTISAVTTVHVGSQVSGIIAKLHADYNSPVKQGQLLAELDPTPFQAQVEQRRADLASAQVKLRKSKIDFDRQARLLEEKLAAQADYDAAKADYEGAQAAVQLSQAALTQAETNLEYTKIVSPIDGVVVDRQYDVGQTVAASFQAPTLFTIAQDLTKMQVQADVDQSDIGTIKTGQPARFTVDAYPDTTFEATIAQIRLNATVNQNVITYPVILSVPNPDLKLRPNMTANVVIEVAKVADVLRVPNAALRFRPVETSGEATKIAAASPSPGAAAAASPAPGHGGWAGRAKDTDRAALAMGGRGFAGAAGALQAAERPAGGRHRQTVYLLTGENELKPVAVRTGITDGRFTAVVDGDLKPGDIIVTGLATSKVTDTGGFPGAGGPGGPRPAGRRT